MSKQQPPKDCSFPGCSYKIKTSSGVSGAYMHLMSHYQRTTYKTRDDICRNSSPEHICIDANMFCVRETAARLMLDQQQAPATGGPTSLASTSSPTATTALIGRRQAPAAQAGQQPQPATAPTANTASAGYPAPDAPTPLASVRCAI